MDFSCGARYSAVGDVHKVCLHRPCRNLNSGNNFRFFSAANASFNTHKHNEVFMIFDRVEPVGEQIVNKSRYLYSYSLAENIVW